MCSLFINPYCFNYMNTPQFGLYYGNFFVPDIIPFFNYNLNFDYENFNTNNSNSNESCISFDKDSTLYKLLNGQIKPPSFDSTEKIETGVVSKTVKSKNSSTSKLDKNFLNKVKSIAQDINCDYRDLIAVMNSESQLNPKAVNKKTKATGLIQFTSSTAKELGTTVDKIKNMSAEEQLDLVKKYLMSKKASAGFDRNHHLSGGELYALVFLPGRANREILCYAGETNSKGEKIKYYEYNKGLDKNHDGKITKTELGERVASRRVSDSIFS